MQTLSATLAAAQKKYDVLPAVSSIEAALRPGAPLVHPAAKDNVAVHVTQRAGDPDAALAEAPHRLRERFTVMRGGGHSMETRGVAARYDEATGQLTVWDSTQSPHYVRNMLAYLYGMPEDDIRVIAPADTGGGFGPKAQFYGEEAVIPWVAKLLHHPRQVDRGPTGELRRHHDGARSDAPHRDRLR